MNILCIDDNLQIRNALKLYFSIELPDAHLITAVDGLMGLRMVVDFNNCVEPNDYFDVVITDLDMPLYNGWWFVDAVRRAGYKNKLIMLTGDKLNEYQIEKLKTDYQCVYVQKSLDLGGLMEEIKK